MRCGSDKVLRDEREQDKEGVQKGNKVRVKGSSNL